MTYFRSPIAWAAATALGAATGCGDGAIVRVRAERGRYAAGDSVAVVAANVSHGEIVAMNLCPWRLERADGPAWRVVARSPGPDTACALTARPLVPGERATSALRLPTRLAPARYRIEFPWLTRERGVPLGEADRRTATFEVR